MSLILKGLSALDKYRQSLIVFYLKELSLADEKEEFMKLYDSKMEKMIHSLLSFEEYKKEDIIQILEYGNSLHSSMKIA